MEILILKNEENFVNGTIKLVQHAHHAIQHWMIPSGYGSVVRTALLDREQLIIVQYILQMKQMRCKQCEL